MQDDPSFASLYAHFERGGVPLSEAMKRDVATTFHVMGRKRHRHLIEPGDTRLVDYWVYEGMLRSYCTDQLGKEHILQLATEDYWISDYGAYFAGTPAKLHVECLEDCALLTISLADRDGLCRRHPELEYFWDKKLRAALVSQQDRTLRQLSLDARARYDHLAGSRPDLLQRLPKRHLAAYLGLSRETLSRMV